MATTSATTSTYQQAPTSTAKSKAINRLPKEHYRNRIEKWHSTLYERGIRTGASDPNNHKKWGSFRLNVDQSPQPFARETTMTYKEIQLRDEENREKRIWTAQTDTGTASVSVLYRFVSDQLESSLA